MRTDFPNNPVGSTRRWFVFFSAAAAWLAARLIYDSLRQLVPDEAYYWVWSRHPAFGYLDHPPMVAWIIFAGTHLLGTSELGVRAGAAILTLGSIFVTVGLAHRVCAGGRAARLAGWILMAGPMATALGTIVTPDTPACFFGIAALAAAVMACSPSRSPLWWLIFGACAGGALLSKYTAVLLPAGVGLALLSSAEGRRHLASAWPWLGLALAAAVFWPVVRWNQQHDWASFNFQLHHGTAADESSPLRNLGIYWGGQFAIYSPVLFVLGLLAMLRQWRRVGTISVADRMILFSATLPFVCFCVFALRHRPEANWPIFALLPLTVLLAQWVAQGWRSELMRWTRIGLIVSVSMMALAQAPEIMDLVPASVVANIPSPWEDMFGWREMGMALGKLAGDGAVVYCTTYENAAEASFYMQGRPDVWTIATGRPTEFDYFAGRPAEQSLSRAVCVTRATEEPIVPQALAGFSVAFTEPWQTTALGRVVRRRRFIVLRSMSSP